MMAYYTFYWWVREGYNATKQWLKNSWRFRKELSEFYDWNHNLGLFRKTLEFNYLSLEKGNEVAISRLKKLEKIRRCIEIIRHFEDDDFRLLAEEELHTITITHPFKFEPIENSEGFLELVDDYTEEEKENNQEIYYKTVEIENALWKELWSTIQGQDYKKLMEPILVEGKLTTPEWDNLFDGSGLLGWWD